LPQSAPLLVQSITPTIASGAPTGTPLVISAPPSTPTGPVTALVIDGTKLPSGTVIELQNVGFAALIGPVHASGGDGQQTVFGDSAEQYIVLGADDDVLHGGAGNDIVGSEGGNDKIYGDEGNDIVFGGAGNDTIDGGSGTDTVLLQGASRADYSLRFDHGNLVATQLHGGPDGTDIIAHVELLRFAGAAPDMGVDATLRRLYDTLFDRAADKDGAAFWSGVNAHGVSMHDIAAALLASTEAAGLAGLSGNAAFVDRLYLDALGTQPLHAASPEERAHWIAQLDQGTVDRASVVVGIANSATKLALDAGEQSELAFSATDASTLVRLYSTLFGRNADEGGVNYWIGVSEAGMGMHDIAVAFLQSAEAQQHYGGTGDDQFIEALYSVGLGRHASSAEIGYWADKLHTGALSRVDVILYFTDSPEQVTLVGHSTSLPVG
jgi:Ca2+-binding RTX toxin-like protein